MRYSFPQPYRDLDHTADVGVEVEGASADEALARLVLAQAALLTGDVAPFPEQEARIGVPAAAPTTMAVMLLRELLFRFATERLVAGWCEVLAFHEERGAEVRVGLGPFDPERHGSGLDLKAVTWHEARLAPDGGRWRGRIVFDI